MIKEPTGISLRLSMLLLLTSAALGGLMIVDIPVNEVTIVIDFNDLDQGQEVDPVWNTLNIWDVSHLNGSFANYNSTTYPERYFFVDHLNIMTATGGRSTGSNEYYSEDANGNPVYDFTPLLKAVSWIIEADLISTIVVGNVPIAIIVFSRSRSLHR